MDNKNLLLKSAKNLKGTLRQFLIVALLGDKSYVVDLRRNDLKYEFNSVGRQKIISNLKDNYEIRCKRFSRFLNCWYFR